MTIFSVFVGSKAASYTTLYFNGLLLECLLLREIPARDLCGILVPWKGCRTALPSHIRYNTAADVSYGSHAANTNFRRGSAGRKEGPVVATSPPQLWSVALDPPEQKLN